MSAAEQPRRLLGLLLIEMGVISQEQLEEALAVQARTGERLGEILIERGYTSRLAIQDALAEQKTHEQLHAELERELELARSAQSEAEAAAREHGRRLSAKDHGLEEEAALRVAAETAVQRARVELEHLRAERRDGDQRLAQLE